MRFLVVLIFASLLALACSDNNENKVIYLVRHAEKDVAPKNDPPLTTDGVIRSVDLASWFKDIEIDTVFSTNYVRTKETAKPLAEEQDIEISYYKAQDFDGFAKELKSIEADTILIVGHSNTILEQIEALGFEKPQKQIGEKEYDKIFEVRFSTNEVKSHLYGSKSEN